MTQRLQITGRGVALPPKELIARVGDDPGDTVSEFHGRGARHRALLEAYLPADWVWSGKTFLDWGAGAGRLVRHFLREAETNRVIAADIHEPSMVWIRDHLAPIETLLLREEPGIPLDDDSVDLVTGLSVMTHITDYWAGWLLELRRVLKPGGIALLSFCGESMVPLVLGRSVPVDDIGMLVIKYGNPWRFGGPTVLHSPWWIRVHWARALEVERIDPTAIQGIKTGHDLALLRKTKASAPSIDELMAIDPTDQREVRALATGLAEARGELTDLRTGYETARDEAIEQRLVAEDRALKLSIVRSSNSWRITKPLRRIGNWIRPTDGWTLD